MPLRLYNTLTQAAEPFEPLVAGQVRMYVCGVTVYDLCHIGHARMALAFEVVRRYLAYSGYRVTLVRNFTDLDDKIIKRAAEQGRSWSAVAEEFTAAFRQDLEALGLAPADVEPKATEHIPEMVALIRRLVERGLAYAVDGDVYYAVRRFPSYGKLSHRSPDELLAGARIEVDERKRDPLDFALWKASKPGEPAWDSPWGRGRPGWHIECSAMAGKYLGESFDIHAGGEDLIFPHHENEIAQSEGATGRPFARYWLHNGFVTVNGEKMSKSLGNFVTIRQALQRSSAEAVKLLLLSTNYRSPLDYTEAAVAEKARALAGVQEFMRRVEILAAETGSPATAAADESGGAGQAGSRRPASTARAGDRDGCGVVSGGLTASIPRAREPAPVGEDAFRDAMDDDFNTARASGVLFDLVREGNRLLQEARQPGGAARCLPRLQETASALRRLGQVLALDLRSGLTLVEKLNGVSMTRPVEAVQAELARLVGDRPADPAAFQSRLSAVLAELLAQREAARRDRNWAAADAIRQSLAAHTIRLDDSRTATHAVSEFAAERGLPPVAVTLLKS
ncbi:MAG: cysteine--tRNA ligase [candidate division NC10 bacterium]|nr:cysteine--tRNA ligase [candidate division NC10 bacterium]